MAFIDEWHQWYDARTSALAAPYGPLASMCGPRVQSSAGAAPLPEEIRPARPLPLSVARSWEGRLRRIRLGVPDESIEIEYLTVQQRNLIEAEGVFALNAIEDRIHRLTFGGLEVFEPHHDWVIPAVVEERSTDLSLRAPAACTDGRDRTIVLDAVIRFSIDGQEFELAATHEPRGAFHAIFSDETRVEAFGFRNIHIPAPDAYQRTTIDFNRAVLPLAALSTRFPALMAPPGNHIDLPVTAGEHRPYLDDAAEQVVPA